MAPLMSDHRHTPVLLAPAPLSPVYQALCLSLSNRSSEAPWRSFSIDDWLDLRHMAQAHGVAGLLYWMFRHEYQPDSVPGPILAALAQDYYSTAGRNTLLYLELNRILDALDSIGVPCVVLKGAALAATLYPQIALRPMGDLDLLIPQDRLAEVVSLARDLSYEPEPAKIGLGADALFSYEINFDGGKDIPTHVEFHWSLIGGARSRYQPRIDWFWQQVERTRLGERAALVLKPTAHLLYLAAHLELKHNGVRERLLWGYDLHSLICRHCDALDWDELLARSLEFNWGVAIYNALEDVQRHFATPLPDGFLEEFAAQGRFSESMMAQSRSRSPRTRTDATLRKVSNLDWAARVSILVGLLFPDPAYLRQRYLHKAQWLWPLSYPLRWFDVIADVIRTIMRTGNDD